jgi:BASS family bile acid:Na+ symporter
MASFYVQYEYWFATFQLVMAMLGMGATLSLRDFGDVVREPKSVSLGLVIQLVLVPLIAFLFLRGLDITGGVAIGIALIAAIPGGTISNIFTFMAGGNSALSISITALTTLACLVTTPVILTVLVSESLPADFSMPTGQIVIEIALALLLPLILGMLYLYLYPGRAPALSKWSIRASLSGIVLIVIGSASAGRLDGDAFGVNNMQLLFLFILIVTAAGCLATRLFRRSRADATAIEIEVVIRNVNLGVMLKASLFPAASMATAKIGDIVLFTLLFYAVMQLFVAAAMIKLDTRSTDQ